MNYEDLNEQLQNIAKKLKDSIAAAQKQQKAIVKDADKGDLKDLARCMDGLTAALTAQQEAAGAMAQALSEFDSAQYFQSGDFTGQMLEECRAQGVDVHGEFPVFEMFPFSVRIDADNQDIYLDRKKVPCMRPAVFVGTVKEKQEKLRKNKADVSSFAAELASAYDLTALRTGKKPGSDIYLTAIYKTMVPMSRLRREYDMNSFAYDLARLYAADTVELKDGRRYQFGSSRNISKCIRILDQDAHEQYLATIQFV